jgi:hypothetical protein
MSPGVGTVVAGVLIGCLVGLGPGPQASSPAPAEANGDTQREIQGRVESVNAARGTLVVTREFRGRTSTVRLTAGPDVRVFACADERAGLDRVRTGMIVTAFYEVVGADGVVNLIVVEPVQ